MSGCGCKTMAGGGAAGPGRSVTVEFLYLDREVCDRCGGTAERLEEALTRVRPALEALGLGLDVRHIHVRTAEEARDLRFVSSPTIRVDGRDIAGAVEESECGSCSDLAGQTPVDCRQWTWRGKTDTAAPVGLIVEAILLAALGVPRDEHAPVEPFAVPDNLHRFFQARENARARTCC